MNQSKQEMCESKEKILKDKKAELAKLHAEILQLENGRVSIPQEKWDDIITTIAVAISAFCGDVDINRTIQEQEFDIDYDNRICLTNCYLSLEDLENLNCTALCNGPYRGCFLALL